MTVASVVSILKGQHPNEAQVIAEGWVRTRRDSKAGISFLNVYFCKIPYLIGHS